MKSLYDLLHGVLTNSLSTIPVSTEAVMNDLRTIHRRVENEGDTFLKITLPEFGKAFFACIELGHIEPSLFPSFRCKDGTPVLFQGYTALVFDKNSRKLFDQPCIEAIALIRQVTCMFSKIKCDFSPKTKYNAERKFIECDDRISNIYADNDLRRFAAILWSSVLKDYDDSRSSFLFKHGPGAVANPHVKGFTKYLVKDYTQALDRRFPYADCMFFNYNHWASYIRSEAATCGYSSDGSLVTFIDRPRGSSSIDDLRVEQFSISRSGELYSSDQESEIPVRVVFVPKTVKGPRTIAIEPAYMQFIQQGIKNFLYQLLESHPLTEKSVNFSDQTRSQRMAAASSISRDYATIDLSDASDSVSWNLVRDVFSVAPEFVADLEASRSKHALLPSGYVKPLYKYASMGSALCFPIEAMVFYTIALLAYHKVRGIRPSQGSIRHAKDHICIYGDDIIVPTDTVETLYTLLKRYGLKVNAQKSYFRSHFREACGKEYYNGVDITPIYLRVDPFKGGTKHEEVASSLSSYYAFRNGMYNIGYWGVVQKLDTAYLHGHIFPGYKLHRTNSIYDSESGFIGRRSVLPFEVHKFDKQTQSWRSRGYTIKAKRKLLPECIERLEKWLSLNALTSSQIRDIFSIATQSHEYEMTRSLRLVWRA